MRVIPPLRRKPSEVDIVLGRCGNRLLRDARIIRSGHADRRLLAKAPWMVEGLDVELIYGMARFNSSLARWAAGVRCMKRTLDNLAHAPSAETTRKGKKSGQFLTSRDAGERWKSASQTGVENGAR